MRVAVVDDEALVRSFVRSLVLEARSDVVVVEAADGAAFAALAAEGRVDAAFVDIRMPRMDGFAALAALRASGRRIPWFVLSSHSDFSYAQKAIELGALGYALKPPSPEEIRAALAKLAAALEEDRSQAAERLERDWALFASGTAEKPPEIGPLARCVAALAALDGEGGRGTAERRAAAAARVFGERGRRWAEESLRVAAVPLGASGEVGVLLSYPQRNPNAEAAAKRFWNEAAAAVEADAADAGVSVRALILVSAAAEDASASRDALAVLRRIASHRALLPGGVLAAERAEALLSVIPSADLAAAERAAALAARLGDGDPVALREAVRDYLAAPSGNRGVARFLERCLGAAGSARTEDELRAACERLSESPCRSPERGTIAEVEAFIRRRYAEGVTVEDAAGVFGLTPNYLSSLFRKRTGTTFVRYLTELRLLKARELLREGRSVKETARAVGYGSERHFSRLYRGRFGNPPAFEKKNAAKS